MSALTSYIRQAEAVGQTPRQALTTLDSAVQTELEAMHTIARALATLPDKSACARVTAWAASVFAGTEETEAASARANTGGSIETDSPALESFESEAGSTLAAAAVTRFGSAPPDIRSGSEASTDGEEGGQPRAVESSSAPADVPEPLSAADIDALSMHDVDNLFDDSRPPQGQFPPRPIRSRLLRPRLVLRFRLWR